LNFLDEFSVDLIEMSKRPREIIRKKFNISSVFSCLSITWIYLVEERRWLSQVIRYIEISNRWISISQLFFALPMKKISIFCWLEFLSVDLF